MLDIYSAIGLSKFSDKPKLCNVRSVYCIQKEKQIPFRYISISGLAEDVKLAEILIYQTLTNQPMHESLELKIPNLFIGAIIGRNGDSIRSMQDRSKCRIDVERRSDQADRKVVLRGTKDQIQMAKNFILDIVKEEKVFKGIEKTLFLTSEPCENGDEKALKMAEQNLLEGEELDQDVTEIYVSSVMDPDLFYVQKVGAKSVELDKLVQEMTAFYELQGV